MRTERPEIIFYQTDLGYFLEASELKIKKMSVILT